MGCASSAPAAKPEGPNWNEADIVVYTCADSTDNDDAMFIMKGPDGTERQDMDATMVMIDADKMTISKALMEDKTLKFYVVKVMPEGVEKIIKVEVA